MGKALILVADDEYRIVRLVSDFLKKEGFDTLAAYDGEQAFSLFTEYGSELSLVILDVMMPVRDGWSVLASIREISDLPVIMLTAKGEDQDQLTGFASGADDYCTKPFSPSVLVARVKSLLKRTRKLGAKKLVFSGFELDTDAHVVTSCGGEELLLTPKEFDLLLYLINHRGMALSREQLLNAVWNYDYYGDVRTVDTHVKQLRAKLGADAIQTVRGLGYRFTGKKE